MSAADWTALKAFVRKFEMLRGRVDVVGFRVVGETRWFDLVPRKRRRPEWQRRVLFEVPRCSLMVSVERGCFDDLLTGNFKKTRIYNFALYPGFSPTIAKTGGSAKVLTRAELSKFRWHYFRASPGAMVRHHLGSAWRNRLRPLLRATVGRLGLFRFGKRVLQRLRGLPQTLD